MLPSYTGSNGFVGQDIITIYGFNPGFYLPLTEKALVTRMSSQALTDPTRLLTFGVEFE